MISTTQEAGPIVQLDHHLHRMSPGPLDYYAELSEALIIRMSDRRDAAAIHRRWAREKDAEADKIRARVNRISMVRARLLRGAL